MMIEALLRPSDRKSNLHENTWARRSLIILNESLGVKCEECQEILTDDDLLFA